ncbi:hypothetical protein Glove_109g194 [Diversispora epigaea]|uniref:Ion transport domain-containing protein n=1 Tax=Diversispora epigaea TaxID=1348612 RepID=A0A397J5M7_9GLOM|nr:hypothetical protein Glove_109g194 [Diversispora epigaea]
MSKKHHSSFSNENGKVSSDESITISTDSLFFGSYIAISPDSQQIVTFSPETHEFKLYNIDDLSSSKRIFTLEYEVNDKHLFWSIAISNCVDDDENERLIALSCFDARGLHHNIMNGDDENDLDFGDKVNNQCGDSENDLESGDKVKNENDLECSNKVNNQYRDDESVLKYDDNCLRPQTWIISTKDGSKIYTSLESIGGVIRFLNRNNNDDSDESDSDDSDDSSQPLKLRNKSVIIIVNASGIFKETIKKKRRKQPAKFTQFELPQQLSIGLSRDHWQNSLELLHTSIIKNHFMVHSFKNRKQIIEMYSLISGDLEMLFKRHEFSNIIYGPPIFAISQNEKILAFCRGTPSITLYFMENGLEITTKQLEGQSGIYKIVAMNFIDDDSKLLIILEEKDQHRGIFKNQIFVVWDLFTTFENSIRQIDYSEPLNPLKMDVTHRLMNFPGKMFAVRDGGGVFSVLQHKDMALIRNPSTMAMTKIDITTRDHVYHAIYNIDGERSDTSKLAKNRIIINNVEPWHPNKNYFRISVYLDSTKSTQLIISSNSVQVWKKNNTNTLEKPGKHDRVLEYIWARNKVIDVRELRIGEREFVLKVSVPSTKCFTPPKSMTIHWPNNSNVLEGACQALYVLEKKKHIITGHENVNKIKYLIECTQKLVRKYITKYGIFRLTSIRYPIMKYLIKSNQESLIKHILNKKINSKNSNIYIPRLYKWTADEDDNRSTTEISKSDLHHAISCIQKIGDSTVILKYLIDYYADNTKEYNNHGWMFTVSKAIPLLYDSQLREFVQYLFKKPCFGITEAYTPPLHINPYDKKKGNNTAVIHSLAVKPHLASKFHNTLWNSLKKLFTRVETSRNDRKVYMVPLPDFTVYPNSKDPKDLEDSEDYSNYFWFLFTFFRIFFWPRRKVINNRKKMSPFLRVIHEEKEKGYEIYQAPTMMAVLDFKWPAARQYFIRHIFMYIFYAISYIIIVNSFSTSYSSYHESQIANSFKMDSIILTIFLFVYLYTGWYLTVTEIVQLKRVGWYRYINIYNMFDLVSVLLPFAYILFYQMIVYRHLVGAITALVMWFEVVGTIWPFFAFMMIVILAFGHTMFILLNHEGFVPMIGSTYRIRDLTNLNLYSNIIIQEDTDTSSKLENVYSDYFSLIGSMFFWISENSHFSYIINILRSIILVLFFQNMLIAFMNGAFDKANKESRIAAHRYRAELVAEYEALEKPLDSKRGNPQYIYYIPNPDVIDTWLKETKKDEEQKLRLIGENLAELTDLTDLTDFDYSDDDDKDFNNQDNSSYSKKYIQNEDSSSTIDSDSSTTKYNDIIDKISFIDEEIFLLKVSSKLKSNNKLLKNVSCNESSNEPLSKDHPVPTANVDDQLSIQERLNNLENEFKTRFNNQETRFDELDQNLKIILKTLNNLNNPK